MLELLKQEIKKALKKGFDYETDVNIIIEKPTLKENGDYSTNIAMQLSKELKQSPTLIAENLIKQINNNIIIKIEIKEPGFINFFVNKKYLLENINKVIMSGDNYGRSDIGNGKKVNYEFVSANPTGILHLGNARGGAYGDNMARILNFTGFDVTKEYYINDAGNQMDNLGLSIKARYLELCKENATIPENGYHGKEIIDIAQKIYNEFEKSKIDTDISYFRDYGLNILMEQIKADLKKYRVEYDIFTSERSIYEKKSIPKILQFYDEKGYTYENEGALWLKTSLVEDSKDHVLVKNDKNYTYLLPDIAYHVDKIERGYESLVDILGADHHGYVSRIRSALSLLGYNKDILNIKLLQLVKMIKNGEEVKMSKRTGQSVSLSDLIDEIGVNAARYFFASRSLDTQMDIDIDIATKNTNENPIYYICYAYARVCTILKENDKNIKVEKYETITTEEAYTVLEKIYNFENIVINAAEKELPHLIANYVYDLATSFHLLYNNYKFVSENQQKHNENMNLLKAIKITLNNALNLIGIIPPERM